MKTPIEKIGTWALVLLVTGAIDSIRNLPATALFGSSLIFFFLLGALFFLIPVALVSAELASNWPESEGGIYDWVRHALGNKIAFIAIWLQWVNTLVWFPTLLSFIAGTAAYLIDPTLANNKYYLISIILVVFWSLTLLNLNGLKTSAMFASICTVLGMIIPMTLIIIMALYWFILGNPIQIHLDLPHLIPHLEQKESYISLTAVMTAFLGMELAGVHIKQVHNPKRNFPRAMFFSTILILTTMILGSLAIAIVLPKNEINLVSGVMQAFHNFLGQYHLSYAQPILVIMLLIGSLGGMVNWIISPAKGLLEAANHDYLPHFLTKLNKHHVAYRILIIQAMFVTAVCVVFSLVPSINGIYWLFTDLSTELYMIMYALLFIAAIVIKAKGHSKTTGNHYQIPGGKLGFYFTCAAGLIGCAVTLYIGFFPPEQAVSLSEQGRFTVIFSTGLLLMLLPALIIIGVKQLSKKPVLK